jgi:hypothetical protein
VAEIEKGVQLGVDLKDHIPTPAAIPPIRAAAGHILFLTKVDHPVATATGLHKYLCFIKKHGAMSPFGLKFFH